MPLFYIYKEMIYLRQYIENNGIILKRNVDSNGNLFAVKVVSEHKQIYKGTVMLEGIPSEFHRVFIEGYTENIPARDEYSKLIRKAFIPDEDSVILSKYSSLVTSMNISLP